MELSSGVAPTIYTEDLTAEISRAARITDLHLNFSYEAVERIDVNGAQITVTIKEISAEQKSDFLHKQNH